jgi:transposase
MKIKPANYQGICKIHYNKGVRLTDFESSSSTSSESSSPSKSSSRLEIFSHDHEDSNRMTAEQRRGIVILHQDENSIEEICSKVGCSKPTAYHWINHYRATGNFDDDLREGRKRKVDELTVAEIVDISKQDHFKTPKGTQKTTKTHQHSRTHTLTHLL